MPTILNICGNIGAGKSTLVSAVREKIGIPAIIEDTSKISMFNEYCSHPEIWASHAQMQFLSSKAIGLIGAMKEKFSLVDRSIHEDFYVFCGIHRDLGHIDDNQIKSIEAIYSAFTAFTKLEEINILVTCSKAERHRRIATRSKSELSMLNDEYLSRIDKAYSEFTNRIVPTLVFNSEVDDLWDFVELLQEKLSRKS